MSIETPNRKIQEEFYPKSKSSSERKVTNNKKRGEWRPYREEREAEYLISQSAGVNPHPVPPLDHGRWGVNKIAPVGVRRNDMGRRWDVLPYRPRTPRLKPHTTPPNQILTETRRGKKITTNQAHLRSPMPYHALHVHKKIYITNTHSPNTTSLQQLNSHLNQNSRLTKKIDKPQHTEEKKKTKFQAQT
ncbi:hypothetical protein TNCV_4553141 [Trichonephila clavipes]|nr:hypothetical protein TNCV_4553141 [Trichonephila clavipes]